MTVIAFLSYFTVPVSYFILKCKKTQLAGLIIGTLAFLVQMSLSTSYNSEFDWHFGIGWGGVVNGILSCIYRWFHEDQKPTDDPKKFSSVLNCWACLFWAIANGGFVWVSMLFGEEPALSAAVIIDIFALISASIAMFFSFYECKTSKIIANVATLVIMIVDAGIWTYYFAEPSAVLFDYTGTVLSTGELVAFSFTWISVIASGLALIFVLFVEKKD